ncbi:hypothetical protein HS088_TW10G00451 [Tripterygium wilfordii]|uniref:Uncharacterized protein n=1 Tax=Tripterygium wilfordii TaxID=458696 RepID=A0A7J7D538_TRIWF|nr:hypothetical protein HS088_TW10G00451 [Tripterygium wilfordii]
MQILLFENQIFGVVLKSLWGHFISTSFQLLKLDYLNFLNFYPSNYVLFKVEVILLMMLAMRQRGPLAMGSTHISVSLSHGNGVIGFVASRRSSIGIYGLDSCCECGL